MPLEDTEWHHIAYTYDGVTWSGYIDGIQVFTHDGAFVRERILRPSAYILALVIDLLRCGDEFPALRAALEPTLRRLPSTGLGVRAALASRPLSAGQKLLALRMYESPVAATLFWWLGSTAERILAEAGCSVLTIPPETEAAGEAPAARSAG